MNINDEITFNGKRYTAVMYDERTSLNMLTTDADPQCRICPLNVGRDECKYKQECHGDVPFVFVESVYVNAQRL